jgi:hypothetical protein
MAYYKSGKPEAGAAELKKALELSSTFDGADEARKTLGEIGK